MPAKKVLIIDDETDIINVLEEILKFSGHDVRSADNAETALNILENMRFNIIITDHTMPPGMNGAELTGVVKSLYPETIVIGISGHHCRDVFLDAGAEFFLSKPIDFEELLSIIGQ